MESYFNLRRQHFKTTCDKNYVRSEIDLKLPQSCSPRDRGLGLESARDRFFAVLVLVLVSALPVLVLASVSKCRSWTSFQDHSCICRTILFGCLFLPVTQVTKFLSLDLLFFVTILTSLRYISLPTFQVLSISHVYSNFSCVIFTETVFWWSWSWSWNSGLDYKTGAHTEPKRKLTNKSGAKTKFKLQCNCLVVRPAQPIFGHVSLQSRHETEYFTLKLHTKQTFIHGGTQNKSSSLGHNCIKWYWNIPSHLKRLVALPCAMSVISMSISMSVYFTSSVSVKRGLRVFYPQNLAKTHKKWRLCVKERTKFPLWRTQLNCLASGWPANCVQRVSCHVKFVTTIYYYFNFSSVCLLSWLVTYN